MKTKEGKTNGKSKRTMEKRRGVEMTQEKIKTVCVDKVAYEAVLRNSIKVNDLEAENQQLKFLLKECRYKIIADLDNARLCESSVDIEDFEYLLNRIDNAIGEKK